MLSVLCTALWAKKQDTKLLPTTFPNINRFSKFFHWHTHTHLTALCPGLPGWAGTTKVKPTWILLKQEISLYKKVAHTRLPRIGFWSWSQFSAVSLQVMWVKPGGRLPLLSVRPVVTPATLKRAATSFAAGWTEARWVWTVCLRLLPDSVTTAIWIYAILRLSPARWPRGYRATQVTWHHNASKLHICALWRGNIYIVCSRIYFKHEHLHATCLQWEGDACSTLCPNKNVHLLFYD